MLIKTVLGACFVALSSAAPRNECTSAPVVAKPIGNVTVAMVRSAPPSWPMPIFNFDWTGTQLNITQIALEGARLMEKAKSEGADLITFPELWFPGFPKGNAINNWTEEYLPMYIENSITVGDSTWQILLDGAKSAGIYAGIMFSERDGDHIYMAQALLSPKGAIIHHRRKLRPSGSERWFFSDGTMEGLQVQTTDIGRVGMLECGEHYNPSMTFITQAQSENLHLAPFPYMGDAGDPEATWWEDSLANVGTLRHYAVLQGGYVFMNAIGYAIALDQLGQTVTEMSATVNMTTDPILYATVSGALFNTSKTFDSDSQTSWGVLKQMVDGFPEDIPRVEGSLVPYQEHSVSWMLTGALTAEIGATGTGQ